MDISRIIVFVIYLLSLLLMGVLIALLLTGARSTSKRFIIFIFTLFVWLLPQFLSQFIFSSNKFISHTLIRTSILFSGFVAITLTEFISETITNYRLRVMRIIGYASLLVGIINFVRFDKLDVSVSKAGIAITSNEPYYLLLTLSVFAGFLTAIISIRRYEKSLTSRDSKKALLSLRRALWSTLILNLIGALFLAKYEWSQVLTPVSMALTTAVMYIAIFKHRLYDVRRLVARSVAYIGTVLVLTVLYGWLAFGVVSKFFFKNNSITFFEEFIQVLLVVIAAFTLQPLRKLFNKLSNSIFYRDAYDSSKFLADFNKILVSTIDLHELLTNSAKVAKENLKSLYCAFYIAETTHSGQRILSNSSVTFTEELSNEVMEIMQKDVNRVIITEKLAINDKLRALLLKSDIAVIVRLNSKNQDRANTIGFMVLGDKESGNLYSSEDISLVQILANELTIAIQNSLRYEEIESFNETLQQKVTDATRELRKTNEKLKALDEAKDEFISMASHQLRTPLTSVKGYVSMVLEGDVGKISKSQRELLEEAFASSQRMVYLIADLLNVSRLRTGKFVIQSTPTKLEDVVEGEVKQLVETAKVHNLDLEYIKPKTFPVMSLDETKTRQVIMNFIDNAIYYTPAGGHIRVELKETPHSIEYRVIDDGLGVPKHEQHHLFTKFFRAGNARKARPDGTGLGLYMAKKVIVAQGGGILFESEEGKGSTFGFTFPRKELEVKTSK